jgi:O-antigen ligase
MQNDDTEKKLAFHKFFIYFYSFIIFIQIIKFGIPACLPEVNSFPVNFAEWLIFSWPPVLFTSINGFLLLITVLYSFTKNKKNGNYKFQIPGLWILFCLFSLLGFAKATCFDSPYTQCFYFIGITASATSIYYLKKIYSYDCLLKYLIGAIFWASICIILYGLNQYFYGFNETRELFFSFSNISTAGNFYTRLMQNFIFSTFSLTNTYAGFLILTIPLSVWYINTYTTTSFLKYSFTTIYLLVSFTSLLLTGSRSGIISFATAVLIVIILLPFHKKIKVTALFFMIFSIIACIFYFDNKGAPSESILVRLDYYAVAVKLFVKNIFTGSGWGNFFYRFGFMKSYPSPEGAHTPHNFILNTFSQSGIFGGITIIFIFLLPIVTLFKKIYKKKQFFNNSNPYILCGLTALFIHMLLDVDFQVPAIILVATILSILAIADESIKLNLKNAHNSLLIVKNKTILICSVILIITITWISFKILPARYSTQKLYTECNPILYSDSKYTKKELQRKKIKKLFIEAIEKQPYSPYPWEIMGNYALKNRNWAVAEYSFSNAVLRSPQRAVYYYKLFISQVYQKKIPKAIKNLEIAKNLFPELYNSKYNKFIKQLKETGYVQ